MLQVAYTHVFQDENGIRFELERLGHAVLGPTIWCLMGNLVAPKWVWTEIAWANAVRANPRGSIEAYARIRKARGEAVDESMLGEALKMVEVSDEAC